VQPLLESLQSDLRLGFLDDFTLGGPADMVAADVAEIVRVGGSMGLELNMSKSELIAHQELLVNDCTLQSFMRVNVSDASLLGSPIFPGPVLDNTWSDLCEALDRDGDRLCRVSSQDALILLRSCLSAPKVLHILRCSPSVSHPSLQLFDSLLQSALHRICNSDFSDSQWLQASLPIRNGAWGETYVFARTSCLSGFNGEHTLPPERNPVRMCRL